MLDERLQFGEAEEKALWDAFDEDPKIALSRAITGLRRLYLQGLADKGRFLTMAPPQPLSAQELIEMRKRVRLNLQPWGETLAFAAQVQQAQDQRWKDLVHQTAASS